ncbi:mannitol dehydrogenase family protein, partial [Ameyamaea chiangmaiensis]|nr:mannitol dehydrogenase family protein [Ameyamaea chiangmaiensis]
GAMLRAATAAFAALAGDDALAQWIETQVPFPDTMVDRIVPPPSDQDRTDAQAALGGLRDEAALSAEPWFQWIITDFDGPRPAWDRVGALFVPDVTPFETAKLRMLNGTHMLLAYAGALAGLETIADAARDPVVGTLAARFMLDEQGAAIAFDDDDRRRYAAELMARFRNPAIKHQMDRIGRNGSVKMASRIIEPMRENMLAGRPVPGATLLIACWIRWFTLHEQDELDVALHDPRIDRLAAICRDQRHDYHAQAEAFLTLDDVFGEPLPDHERVVGVVAALLERLDDGDARDVFRAFSVT